MKNINRINSVESEPNEDDKNIETILSKFKDFNNLQDLGNTEQFLIDVLNANTNVCLICIESIENKQPIWNCEGCFAQFHIFCIQNWIRDGSYLSIAQSFNDENKKKDIPWNCPKCRKEYKKESYPSSYYCYCKKTKDPIFDPWSIPHSCSQQCDKIKPCGHSCLMLCHPGPCPPCPKMVRNTCYCGKSDQVSRRCSNKYWSCNKICNKLLACKQHLCQQTCHAGSCDQCQKTSLQFCKCKKKRKEVSCSETIWQCGQICSKPYLCGFHECQLVCHEGKCGECPKSLIRTCPCGKTNSKKPCNEEIPTCGDTCDKKLDCNIHRCANRCHYGQCEECRQVVLKKCRCGQKEKSLPCHTEFTCDFKCNKLKNCGKHKCNKKCCDGNCPPCEQTCNKLLSCKNHKCKNLCHSGTCYPCPLIEEISCPCGSSKIKVPCFKTKSNIKVPCKELCKLPPKCHHEKIQNHKCHYGDCPACKLKCGKVLACNHICPDVCHSAVLTEIIENKNREGPWVPLIIKKETLNQKCKDCCYPVAVKCFGRHETSDLPCHKAVPFNCGRKCGRPLKCTHHTCELECHFIPENEIDDDRKPSSLCEVCERVCEQTRPQGCTHECSIGICHPDDCPKCTKLLKQKCHCKSNFVYFECFKWNSSSKKEQEELASCKVPCSKTLSCEHNCTFLCHPGNCSSVNECQTKVIIKCKCKTIKKSLLCNKIKEDIEIIKLNDNDKRYVLKCNEKCAEKKNLEKGVDQDKITQISNKINQQISDKKSKKNKFFPFILGLFILIISILAYYFFN